MPRSLTIEIEPSIAKYARYCSKYSVADASKKLKITEEKLQKIEEEKLDVSLVLVKRMSIVYKMPLAYFLLQQAPKDIIIPQSFRIVYESTDQDFSPTTMLAIRRARYIQSVIKEVQNEEIKYNFKAATLADKPEELATYFRSLIGVTIDQQKKWKDRDSALREWKEAVESLGIFILQQSLPEKDEVSAFCLADQKPYVIMLNSSEHPNRRIFSLFHEVAHILLHMSGVCTPDNFSRNSYEYVKIEKFCNQFSASFLVPQSDFISNPIVQKLKGVPFEKWDLEDVKTLAFTYRVSQESIYRRLVEVGFLAEEKYKLKRAELLKGFEEYKKKATGKKVIIPQYRKIISKNGHRYTSFVLDSMHSKKITMADVADFLGTTSIHISEIEKHI